MRPGQSHAKQHAAAGIVLGRQLPAMRQHDLARQRQADA